MSREEKSKGAEGGDGRSVRPKDTNRFYKSSSESCLEISSESDEGSVTMVYLDENGRKLSRAEVEKRRSRREYMEWAANQAAHDREMETLEQEQYRKQQRKEAQTKDDERSPKSMFTPSDFVKVEMDTSLTHENTHDQTIRRKKSSSHKKKSTADAIADNLRNMNLDSDQDQDNTPRHRSRQRRHPDNVDYTRTRYTYHDNQSHHRYNMPPVQNIYNTNTNQGPAVFYGTNVQAFNRYMEMFEEYIGNSGISETMWAHKLYEKMSKDIKGVIPKNLEYTANMHTLADMIRSHLEVVGCDEEENYISAFHNMTMNPNEPVKVFASRLLQTFHLAYPTHRNSRDPVLRDNFIRLLPSAMGRHVRLVLTGSGSSGPTYDQLVKNAAAYERDQKLNRPNVIKPPNDNNNFRPPGQSGGKYVTNQRTKVNKVQPHTYFGFDVSNNEEEVQGAEGEIFEQEDLPENVFSPMISSESMTSLRSEQVRHNDFGMTQNYGYMMPHMYAYPPPYVPYEYLRHAATPVFENRGSSMPSQQERPKFHCTYCDTAGHTRKRCYLLMKREKSPDAVWCEICKERYHYSDACQKGKEKKTQNSKSTGERNPSKGGTQ